MVDFPTRIEFLFDVEDGDQVYVLYNSSYSDEEQRVEGRVKDANLSEWTEVVADDAVYRVYGGGVKGRTSGEVVKETENRRQKIGWFNRADRLP